MFLFKILAYPVTAPTNGIVSLMRLIQDEVDNAHSNPETLKNQLIQLQAQLEAGQIDEDTYDELEESILDRLEELDGNACKSSYCRNASL